VTGHGDRDEGSLAARWARPCSSWTTDVLPDELAERVAAMMDAGIQVIKQTLENGRTQ
jgi:hypothetical protein